MLSNTRSSRVCNVWSLITSLYGFFCCYFLSSLVVADLVPCSALLRSLFRQSYPLSCGFSHLLANSMFLCLFGILSSFIRTMCPAHLAQLYYFANYTSFSSNFFSQVFHSPSLPCLYTGYAPYPVVLAYLSVVCIVAVLPKLPQANVLAGTTKESRIWKSLYPS